jgi:hypothetical protein
LRGISSISTRSLENIEISVGIEIEFRHARYLPRLCYRPSAESRNPLLTS